MFDFSHPFYRPLSTRIVIVAVCLGWGVFELMSGAAGWALIFLAAGGYAAYRFFFTFKPEDDA